MNICTDRLDVSMLGVRREVKEVEMQEEGQEEEDGKMRVEKEQEEEEEGRRQESLSILTNGDSVTRLKNQNSAKFSQN